jgi:hypothetical protein
LPEQRLELDASMARRERLEPTQCLCQLPLGSDLAPAAGLVPGNRDVHETLEEVALLGGRRAPRVLELFMGGEVLAGPDELYSCPIRGLELLRLAPVPTLPRA